MRIGLVALGIRGSGRDPKGARGDPGSLGLHWVAEASWGGPDALSLADRVLRAGASTFPVFPECATRADSPLS
jgi:hypothetical protein